MTAMLSEARLAEMRAIETKKFRRFSEANQEEAAKMTAAAYMSRRGSFRRRGSASASSRRPSLAPGGVCGGLSPLAVMHRRPSIDDTIASSSRAVDDAFRLFALDKDTSRRISVADSAIDPSEHEMLAQAFAGRSDHRASFKSMADGDTSPHRSCFRCDHVNRF